MGRIKLSLGKDTDSAVSRRLRQEMRKLGMHSSSCTLQGHRWFTGSVKARSGVLYQSYGNGFGCPDGRDPCSSRSPLFLRDGVFPGREKAEEPRPLRLLVDEQWENDSAARR